MIPGIGSCHVSDNGAFLPNRVPALPIKGHIRSFDVPFGVRQLSTFGCVGSGFSFVTAGTPVSYRFFARRVFRTPTSVTKPPTVGRVLQPTRWSSFVQASSKIFPNFCLTAGRRRIFINKKTVATPPAINAGFLSVLISKVRLPGSGFYRGHDTKLVGRALFCRLNVFASSVNSSGLPVVVKFEYQDFQT